jgi:hypothetical protein|tara:strand:- start:547 stop:1278 length:732 start_codon:yes stop_codon:yes gene_type:complete
MGKNELQFDEKRHLYTLGGKPLTGCTTILSVISKPALINWASNMAVDHIQKHLKGHRLSEADYEEVLAEARKAYARKRDKAGDIGTSVHLVISEIIHKTDILKNLKSYQELDKQGQKMVQNFINWAKENKVKFLESERRVYSEKHWFAGTYDFLCEIDGKTWLGDIKTSSGIYPEMFFQCAGYQICEEEMDPKVKIDGHIIVNLKKDGTINEKRSINNKQNKKAFLSALCLYKTLQKVNNDTL